MSEVEVGLGRVPPGPKYGERAAAEHRSLSQRTREAVVSECRRLKFLALPMLGLMDLRSRSLR